MLLVAAHPQSWMRYVQVLELVCITAIYYAQKAEISSQVASTFFLHVLSTVI
jgi:hypothetical protein